MVDKTVVVVVVDVRVGPVVEGVVVVAPVEEELGEAGSATGNVVEVTATVVGVVVCDVTVTVDGVEALPDTKTIKLNIKIRSSMLFVPRHITC